MEVAGLTVVVGETGTKAILVSNIVEGGQQPLDAVGDQVAQAAATRAAKASFLIRLTKSKSFAQR